MLSFCILDLSVGAPFGAQVLGSSHHLCSYSYRGASPHRDGRSCFFTPCPMNMYGRDAHPNLRLLFPPPHSSRSLLAVLPASPICIFSAPSKRGSLPQTKTKPLKMPSPLLDTRIGCE
ncbi:hypothetical protein BS50DRAFT_385972 [Corynespora cassiicola Philippines]|uniref:Uncharacterized protein n=1 Tax=Corynespora cassiicola Philippines TaxID=1448308 RepID=A0A2T2NPA9_CORCC|nr:hypothetical protein BS50DRAFT_385972 [Corynespora cassiicola Philippines]